MDLPNALSALAFAGGALRSAVEMRDHAKLAETERVLNQRIIETQIACMELLEKVTTAAQSNSVLKDEIRGLEAQIAELREQARQREEVHLITFPGGATVYELAKNRFVRFCQPCMDNRGKRSVLQPKAAHPGESFCPECDTHFQIPEG